MVSSNVPFLQSRNVPSDWHRVPVVGHSFVVLKGSRPATKGPGESERLTEHEPTRIEPSRSHAAVESQTDHASPSRRAPGPDGAPRSAKRLWRAYRAGGAKALVSKRRGQPSNHQLAPDVTAQALELLHSRYPDFGPTLAHEKLTEVHHLPLSVETVRQLQIAADLWAPRRAKKAVIHPLREPRPRRGELVQIDGSPAAWFEDRGPAGSLLVYIDDATGQLQELFFAPSETTFSYFAATRRYLERHGRPVAFYSDTASR